MPASSATSSEAVHVPNHPEGSVRLTSTPSKSMSLMRSAASASTSGETSRFFFTPVKPAM
ncbi:hypothetical protein D3C83_23060 [compost metagenome]